MLDLYLHCRLEKEKEESSGPVYSLCESKYYLGGAANVANNLVGLGSDVTILGVIGNDRYGKLVLSMCKEKHINTDDMLISEDRITAVKTRVLDEAKQKLRYDIEEQYTLTDKECEFICKRISNEIDSNVKCIIVSDYAKGVVNSAAYDELRRKANDMGIPLLLDSKNKDFSIINNIFGLTFTSAELKNFVGNQVYSSENEIDICKNLLSKYNIKNIVLKKNKDGVILINHNAVKCFHSTARKEVNSVGAGDALIAAMGYCITQGYEIKKIVEVSNNISSYVVEKEDTYSIMNEDLKYIIN